MCISKPDAPKVEAPPPPPDPAEFQFATDVTKGTKKNKKTGTASLQIPLNGEGGSGPQSGLRY
jgi:hypothetical protein